MKFSLLKTTLALILVLSNIALAESQIYSLTMGNKAYESKQYVTAVEFYNKVLNNSDITKKERNETTYKIANCYRMMNNQRKAIDNYQRLIRSKYSEEKPELLLHYGFALNTFGNYTEALSMFNQYLKKFPLDKQALAGKESSQYAIDNKIISKKWIVRNVKEINSSSDDFAAVVSDANHSTLVFTSNRKGTTGKDKDNWTNGSFSDLFGASKTKNGSWGNIRLFDETGAINTPANEGVSFFANNFRSLYFTRAERMGKNQPYSQILQTDKTEKGWSKAFVVYANSTGNAGHPAVSSNGLEMIFSSNRSGGFGGKDLWKVSRSTMQESFRNPVNLGATVNTAGDEMFPSIANDTTLYFSSNGLKGLGGLDIYKVRWTASGISDPEHLPSPVNSPEDDFGMSFYANGEKGYFASRRPGGRGGDDIYTFERVKTKISVRGIVSEENGKQSIPNLPFFVTDGTKDTLRLSTDSKGGFVLLDGKVKSNTTYTFIFSKNDYFTKTYELDVLSPQNDTIYQLNTTLLRIPDKPIVLPDIYYEVGKWDLLPQYQDSLMSLVDILVENPKLVIELASHTDSRSSDEFNDVLSQKRAETVVSFLTEKGIQKDRLVAKGYGKRVPRVLTNMIVIQGYTFEAGTKLTEDYILSIKDVKKREVAYQLNRRTEFSVISNNYK